MSATASVNAGRMGMKSDRSQPEPLSIVRVLREHSVGNTDNCPIVYIVDDDPSIREMLSSLLRSIGLRVRLFESAPELLQSELEDVLSCLVLDIRLPGLGGFDLQAELARVNIHIPIVFLTGHGDIQMSVRAMKAGAVDYLSKPFRDQDLIDAVSTALDRDQKRRQYEMSVSDIQARFESLTAREQQVMTFVTA
jgi:FixJ family two-component response regulator